MVRENDTGGARRACALASALGPLALAGLAACSNLTPAASARLEAFDYYWQTLRDGYPYFGRKGVDWDELGKQYRSAVPHAEKPHEFYHLLAGMLSELRDEHVALKVPPALLAEGGVAATALNDVPGFTFTSVGGAVYVAGWPGGSAPRAPDHLPEAERKLPELLRVEGFPVVTSLVHVLFLGPPDSPAELLLQWHDGTRTRHVFNRPRAAAAGSTSVPATSAPGRPKDCELARFGDHGYLRVRTFATEPASELLDRIEAALDEAIADCRGLCLDLRGNGGGSLGVAMGLASRILAEPVRLVDDTPDEQWLLGLVTVTTFETTIFPPRAPRFSGPVVVLIDSDTASAAEHLARVLQRGGAVLVGERTKGLEASVASVQGPDGATLQFAERSILDAGGRRLQDDGVYPDVAVPLRWEDVARLGPQAARAAWQSRLLELAAEILDDGDRSR